MSEHRPDSNPFRLDHLPVVAGQPDPIDHDHDHTDTGDGGNTGNTGDADSAPRPVPWHRWLDPPPAHLTRQPDTSTTRPDPPHRPTEFHSDDHSGDAPILRDCTGDRSGPPDRTVPRTTTTRTGRPLRGVLLAAAIITGLAGAGAAVVFTATASPPEHAATLASSQDNTTVTSTPPAVTSTPAPAPYLGAAGCRDHIDTVTGVVSGTYPGSTDSGPDVIFAFQHAYYALRDGQAAYNLLAPHALVGDSAMLQRGIDKTPAGTRYCVTITPQPTPDEYRVDLVQQPPGQEPQTFAQLVTITTTDDGTTRIAHITDA